MAPIVVPGVCRFSVHGVIADRPWVNILDIHINSSLLTNRDTAILDQAGIINQRWVERFAVFMASTWKLEGTRWVDLDTLDGSTGETVETSGTAVLPQAGTGTGDPLPACVSTLITKVAGGGRGTRPGRLYQAGHVEPNAVGNALTAGGLTGLQAAWNTFLTNINQSAAPLSVGSYDSELVVVRNRIGVPSSFDKVNSLSVQGRFATQRRRLRG